MQNRLGGRGTVWEEARIGGLFLSPPALDREPQRPPLGTYKTKMAARTGKRSILTNFRKNNNNNNNNNYIALIRMRSKRFTSIVLQYDLEI